MLHADAQSKGPVLMGTVGMFSQGSTGLEEPSRNFIPSVTPEPHSKQSKSPSPKLTSAQANELQQVRQREAQNVLDKMFMTFCVLESIYF